MFLEISFLTIRNFSRRFGYLAHQVQPRKDREDHRKIVASMVLERNIAILVTEKLWEFCTHFPGQGRKLLVQALKNMLQSSN